MSSLKTSIATLTFVGAFSGLANAAPVHRMMQNELLQPYAYSQGTLPYGEAEGGVIAEPPGAVGLDANTRAAEAFQDHFRNSY